MKLLVTIFIFTNLTLLQDNSKTKSETIGHWKSRPKRESYKGSWAEIDCIVSEIFFKSDGRYKFILNDSTVEEGNWDVSANGKVLQIVSRAQMPIWNDGLEPLNFPIKTKKGKFVIITFKETVVKNGISEDEYKDYKFTPAKN